MENKAVQNYLINTYNKLAYTHSYAFGYTMANMVYVAIVKDARPILPYITSLDRASKKNGGTIQLKYKPTKAQKAVLIAHADIIKPVCTVDYLEELYHAEGNKDNRGYLFEILVANLFGWTLNEVKNAKFTTSGDIIDTVNNIHYQAKYLKATFTDEKTIHNLLAQVEGEQFSLSPANSDVSQTDTHIRLRERLKAVVIFERAEIKKYF